MLSLCGAHFVAVSQQEVQQAQPGSVALHPVQQVGAVAELAQLFLLLLGERHSCIDTRDRKDRQSARNQAFPKPPPENSRFGMTLENESAVLKQSSKIPVDVKKAELLLLRGEWRVMRELNAQSQRGTLRLVEQNMRTRSTTSPTSLQQSSQLNEANQT